MQQRTNWIAAQTNLTERKLVAFFIGFVRSS
jgi:hypothetical protein